MEPSGISRGSIDFRFEQFSASVKKTRTFQGMEKNVHVSAAFSKFFADVNTISFENIQKQSGLLQQEIQKMPEKDTAADLLGENGYWGVKETSRRISEFVLKGAGDDLERLKAGRDGMRKGFKEAEKAWGGTLPDISHATMEKALQAIDEKIRDLGGSVVEIST
ncbi:MAG: hydrogenase-4 component G [Desulfotignum sp.]